MSSRRRFVYLGLTIVVALVTYWVSDRHYSRLEARADGDDSVAVLTVLVWVAGSLVVSYVLTTGYERSRRSREAARGIREVGRFLFGQEDRR